ncbi:hypothetical protein DDE82_007970 [Stemphylium lycopersici]|nr:hypothetical protein DDE82_007970 [Stemphylium lycopersici]
MRDQYARHEPAMFPAPSSTVPNATMTQQHILDVVNAAPMLGQGPEMGGPCYYPPPEPSVPWSDLMKFTPAEATEQTESLDHDLPPGFPYSTPLATYQRDDRASPSQRSRRGSSVRLKGTPLRNATAPVQTSITQQELAPLKVDSEMMSDMPPTALPASRRDEPKSPKSSSHQQKTRATSTSDDELTIIGMPEEQYKPRPSRSRSLKVDTEEPIDYSVRPERAKKISKRRRATAELDAASVKTPEKIRQICDMGFTPSTTTGALKRNNGDVIQTIDWLVTNNIGHDELAPQSPPKSKPSPQEGGKTSALGPEAVQDIMRNLDTYHRDDESPQSIQPAMPNEGGTVTGSESASNITTSPNARTQPEIAQNTSPTKVQVVIPKKSPKAAATQATDATSAPAKKTKRRKTTLDQPEPNPVTSMPTSTEAKPEKKKGRGRPKKTATTTAPTEPIKDSSERGTKEDLPKEIQQSIEPQSATEKTGSNIEEAPGDLEPSKTVLSESPAHPNPPSKTTSATASETPERSTKPTTDSPIPKGKVPYRVGLSKRARIAPLLRIVKK